MALVSFDVGRIWEPAIFFGKTLPPRRVNTAFVRERSRRKVLDREAPYLFWVGQSLSEPGLYVKENGAPDHWAGKPGWRRKCIQWRVIQAGLFPRETTRAKTVRQAGRKLLPPDVRSRVGSPTNR